MKLTKLHVENFGALHNFDLIPTPGLNRLEYPNGWGKSTLAAFLKAMLYGLPSARGKEENNDRKKYTPWQGGPFGGFIELSCSLGDFRIERSFGQRQLQDSFSVTDLATGRRTDALGEIPGETLFGIGTDGFERSSFYTRRDFADDKAGGADVAARLNSLLDNVEDAGSFDQALDEIKDARRDLQSARGEKLSGLEDQLYDTKRAIARLEEKRADLTLLEERLADCNDSLNALETDKENFRRKKEVYTLLQSRKKLTEEESHIKATLAETETAFRGAPLSAEELATLSDRIRDLQTAKARADALGEAFPQSEYDRLAKDLGSLPSEDTFQKAEALANERKALEEELSALQNKTPEQASAKPLYPVAAVLFVLGLGFVLPALLLKNFLFLIGTAIALAGAGILLALAAKKKTDAKREQDQALTLAQKIESLDEAFGHLVPALDGQPAKEESLYRLRRDAARLAELDAEKERLAKAQATAAELSAPLKDFSARYSIFTDRGDPGSTLARLKDALTQIEWNRRLLSQKEVERKELEEKIGDIPSNLELGEEPDWKAKQSAWDIERKKLEREIDTLSSDIDRIPELSDWVEATQAELARRKEKLAVLDKTEIYLKAAKDSLSTRYRNGIERLLPSYLERAGGANLPESKVDPELQVTYYAGGKSRPLSAFSQGERDLTDFCLRLALTEALTAGGETPFLLLDDPFVNLDDNRFAAAKALLLDLANDYQIFYLVCRREE